VNCVSFIMCFVLFCLFVCFEFLSSSAGHPLQPVFLLGQESASVDKKESLIAQKVSQCLGRGVGFELEAVLGQSTPKLSVDSQHVLKFLLGLSKLLAKMVNHL
jgi:hypothetical protein